MPANIHGTTNSNLPEGELLPDQTQLQQITQGCIANSLKTLTSDQKTVLMQLIQNVKTDVVEVTDKIKSRRSKVRTQIGNLQTQINSLKQGSDDVNKMHGLLNKAVASCSDAAFAVLTSKTLTDQIFGQAIELNYQLTLCQTLDGNLGNQINDAQKTLGILDQINLLLETQ
jgi:hypothetical protein